MCPFSSGSPSIHPTLNQQDGRIRSGRREPLSGLKSWWLMKLFFRLPLQFATVCVVLPTNEDDFSACFYSSPLEMLLHNFHSSSTEKLIVLDQVIFFSSTSPLSIVPSFLLNWLVRHVCPFVQIWAVIVMKYCLPIFIFSLVKSMTMGQRKTKKPSSPDTRVT